MTTLSAPNGVVHYGGASVTTARSADGSIYVIFVGEAPGKVFGTYIYRVRPNGATEWVDLPVFTPGRCGVTVEPDGMYISFPVDRDRRIERIKVPGFVTPNYPGGTQSFPPSPITVAATDTSARASASAALQETSKLTTQIKKLETGLAEVAARPSSSITEQQVRDIAWELAEKRIFAELNGWNNPVKNLLETIIRRIIKNG